MGCNGPPPNTVPSGTTGGIAGDGGMLLGSDGERYRGVGYVVWIPRSNVEQEDSRLVVLYGGGYDGLFMVSIG